MDTRGQDLIVLTKDQVHIIENGLKLAYRHIYMADEAVSEGEASEAVFDALCELIGNKEFTKWTFEFDE